MELLTRYQRNLGPLTPEEQEKLAQSRVCVVGCGGLGGYVIELLGRIGVGQITAVDGDCFDTTNLNRQLYSTEGNIGQSKALAAKERMAAVNPHIHVTPVKAFLTEENAGDIIQNHQLVIDGLDSIPCRRILQKTCRELNIPLIHGAVDGWYAQVCTVLPGDDTLSRLYPVREAEESSAAIGTPSFIPAFAASMQVSEAVKQLLGKGACLRGRVLFADLLTGHFDIMEI